MTDSVFKGFDVASLMATAAAQPNGSQKAKFAADVATALGSGAIYEIRAGVTVPLNESALDGSVVYRTTISGPLTSSSSGVPMPTQFVEPPTINVSNALTTGVVEIIRSASNPAIEIRTPLKAGGGDGFLTASKALNGSYYVRTSGRILVPPAVLDVGAGGGGGGTVLSLEEEMNRSMQKPPPREGRVVHGPNASWGSNHPEATRYPPNYSVPVFSDTGLGSTYGYGAGNLTFLPWLDYWDEATTPWGTAHVTNPHNRKVAMHVRDWYTACYFTDTNQWEVEGPYQLTSLGQVQMYDGNFGLNSNQPSGTFPPSQRVTWSDGTIGARTINESGITSPSQVRHHHSWSTWYDIPSGRHNALYAFATFFKARIEPVTQTVDGTQVNGTATDVANARMLVWCGADHYRAPGNKPDIDAIAHGRPRYITGDYQWFGCWVRKQGNTDQSWIQSHPLPVDE